MGDDERARVEEKGKLFKLYILPALSSKMIACWLEEHQDFEDKKSSGLLQLTNIHTSALRWCHDCVQFRWKLKIVLMFAYGLSITCSYRQDIMSVFYTAKGFNGEYKYWKYYFSIAGYPLLMSYSAIFEYIYARG